MNACYNPGDFKAYFLENMGDLNLPVPANLFDTQRLAIETATLMVGALHMVGPGATVGEMIGATFAIEKTAIVAALSAVGYTGAVVGSIAVASGRSLGCGSRMADMYSFMNQTRLQFPGWESFYMRHPAVLDRSNKRRQIFAQQLLNCPQIFEYA